MRAGTTRPSKGGGNPDTIKGIVAGIVALLAIGFIIWYLMRPAPNPGEIGNTAAGGGATAGGAPIAGQGQPGYGQPQPATGLALPGGKGKR